MQQILKYQSPYVNILQREVNKRVRYYSIRIYQTLFDDYLVQINYGSLKNKSPTGKKEEYYQKLEDALIASKQIIEKKLKRGYKKT